MDIQIVMSFWAVSFLFIITPGVDWAYTISAGLAENKVIPAVTGLLLGHLLATLLVVAGLGAIMSSQAWLMQGLTLAGAIYLVWLAINLFRQPPLPEKYESQQATVADWQWLGKGFVISGLNPKVMLLFLALLPQFIDVNSSWPVAGQLFTLGIIHLIGCGVVYVLVGIAANRLLSARPSLALNFGRVSALVLFIIGISMIINSVKAFGAG